MTTNHDDGAQAPTVVRLTIDTLADVPEPLRPFYTQADGGYRLQLDDEPALLRALREERGSRQAERRGRTDAEREARGLESDLALTRDKLERAQATIATMRAAALDAAVAAAARAAGVSTPATMDATRAARELFDIDAEGTVAAKSGRQTLAQFFEAAKVSSPHWYPATGSGGGASPSGSAPRSGGYTMNRATFESQTPQQRHALLRDGVRLTD